MKMKNTPADFSRGRKAFTAPDGVTVPFMGTTASLLAALGVAVHPEMITPRAPVAQVVTVSNPLRLKTAEIVHLQKLGLAAGLNLSPEMGTDYRAGVLGDMLTVT